MIFHGRDTEEKPRNTHWRKEVDQFKTPVEKFEYLAGLADLSWEDCQDAWFMSRQLIPEIATWLRSQARPDNELAEIVRLLSNRHSWYPGVGECLCEGHKRARKWLSQHDKQGGNRG